VQCDGGRELRFTRLISPQYAPLSRPASPEPHYCSASRGNQAALLADGATFGEIDQAWGYSRQDKNSEQFACLRSQNCRITFCRSWTATSYEARSNRPPLR
jgi:hypothetical protein